MTGGPERRRGATVSDVPGAFWNEAMETLSPVDARRLENERLVEQIAYDHATSPFFRAKLDAAGVRPDDIRRVEDLARIPFMEKREIAESQVGGDAPRRQPVRADRADRPHPGDRRHDRSADADRPDAARHRGLRRGRRDARSGRWVADPATSSSSA